MRFGDSYVCAGKSPPHTTAPLHLISAGPRGDDASNDGAVVVPGTVGAADASGANVVGRRRSVVFLWLLAATLVLGVVFALLHTSGAASGVEGVPRAVLFVVEGLKGTTFNDLLEGNRLPHIRRMLQEQRGVYAMCTAPDDWRCARAVPLEDEITGDALLSADIGVASILTGVSPRRYRVRGDSSSPYQVFARTSLQFPSLALRVTRAGKRVVAFGGSALLNELDARTGQCSVPGFLDTECDALQRSSLSSVDAAASAMSCEHQNSCNLFRRVLMRSSGRDGEEEKQFTERLMDLLGDVPGGGQAGGSSRDESLFIFHFNAIARRAENNSGLPGPRGDARASLEYIAQAFLVDSLIGQVLALLRRRARPRGENWLVVGAGTHCGLTGEKRTGERTGERTVPFFLATYTSGGRGHKDMRPLTPPVTQMDAAATVLSWLGVAPHDGVKEGTQNAEENAAAAAAEGPKWPVDSRALPPSSPPRQTPLDGRPQGICSPGLRPTDCAEEEAPAQS